jgi:hypothetical protein
MKDEQPNQAREQSGLSALQPNSLPHRVGAAGGRCETKLNQSNIMKTKVLLTLAVGATTCLLNAQDANPPQGGQRPPGREGGPGGMRVPNPVIEALDLNKDGTIDADEIAKASESLKKLDKNGDGKLTPDEFRPQRPGGRGGPGGQGGPGGGGAPQRPPSQ